MLDSPFGLLSGVESLSSDSSGGGSVDPDFELQDLFSGGQDGVLLKFDVLSDVFQDVAGTIPTVADSDPIGLIRDSSGNGNDATQATASKKPYFVETSAHAIFDEVDDNLTITIPAGGWTGTMMWATLIDVFAYGVTIPEGTYDLITDGQYTPAIGLVGMLIRDGVMTAEERSQARGAFVELGAAAAHTPTNFVNAWRNFDVMTAFHDVDLSQSQSLTGAWRLCDNLETFEVTDLSATTSLQQAFSGANFVNFPLVTLGSLQNIRWAWFVCRELVSIPALDFSTITVANQAFQGCYDLTTFEPSDMSSVNTVNSMFRGCTSLTSLNYIDFGGCTDFENIFNGCTSLTTLPISGTDPITGDPILGMFQNTAASNFTNAFTNCALDEATVDGILADIALSTIITGLTGGTLNMSGGTNAPPGFIGEIFRDVLTDPISEGGYEWTVTTN